MKCGVDMSNKIVLLLKLGKIRLAARCMKIACVREPKPLMYATWHKGFTLLELIVAMAIFSIIIALAVPMFMTSNAIYSSVRDTNEIQNQVSAMNQTIRSQVSEAFVLEIAPDSSGFASSDYDGYIETIDSDGDGTKDSIVMNGSTLFTAKSLHADSLDIKFLCDAGGTVLTVDTRLKKASGNELYHTSIRIALLNLQADLGGLGISIRGATTGDCILYKSTFS